MEDTLTPKPKNTTKKTGIGCSAFGALLLFSSAIAFLLVAILGFEYVGLIVFGSVFLALGILSFIVGVGMFIQGRRVDKLTSGDDLIASWNYEVDEKGRQKSGYIYIGTKGFYKNGVYTEWMKRKCVLEDVFLTEGEPEKLTFQYVIYSHNSRLPSTPAVRKKTSVPVPIDKKTDAIRVVNHYQQQIERNKQ